MKIIAKPSSLRKIDINKFCREYIMKKTISLLAIIFCIVTLVAIEKNSLPESMRLILDDGTFDAEALYTGLTDFNDFPAWDSIGSLASFTYPVHDTTDAPFHVIVPESYDPSRPTPVYMFLHGGVGVPYFYDDFTKGLATYRYMVNEYSKDYILVYPQSKSDCMWWDEPGYEIVHGILRYLKTQLNIDDDRVYVTGGSDGGSGSYHFALTRPSEFGAFVPIIGMMSVGSFMTNQGAYVVNLANRPIFAANTDKDKLYPAKEMRKYVSLALDAGADIIYKEFNGFGHDEVCIEGDLEFTYDFLKRHPRDPFAPHITWEAEKSIYGDCDWLSIARIDTTMDAEPWHVTYQDSIMNTRLTIGFYSDMEHKARGVRISALADGKTVAKAIGLAPGDIILEFDGEEVNTQEDIDHAKSLTDHGKPIALKVDRNGEELLLEGRIPEAGYFNAFYYPCKSARVDANFYGNTFNIRTSRVRVLKIRIHPDMVVMQDPVRVIVNGEEVFNEVVSFDRDFIRNQFRNYIDRKALWVNELYIPVR